MAALPRGGAPVWAQVAACCGAALALLLAALARDEPAPGAEPGGARAAAARADLSRGKLADRFAEPVTSGLGAWTASLAWAAPALVALVAAAQCLPLPGALLRLLAPVNWEIRALPPALAPGWAPLSLDPAATVASLALPVALACAAAAAGLLGARFRKLLCGAAVAGALLQLAWAAALLAAGGASASGAAAGFTGSFVNRNHLAALLCAGAITAAGAALARGGGRAAPSAGTARPDGPERAPSGGPRWLWACAAIVCGSATLLTLSRGGAAALLLGLSALALSHGRRVRALVAAAGLVAAVLAGALWISAGPLLARSGQLAEFSKLRSFEGAARLVRDHPLLGAGRGAYRYLSERHRSVPGEVTFVYVEDEPLQLAADLGLPAALLVLGALLLAWRRGLRQAAPGLERGAAFALLALGAQSLVDFNLEFAGVALPAAVMLGALSGARPSRRAVAALLCAAPLACAALLWAAAEREAEALLATAPRDLQSAAVQAVARHPADWLISLAPAARLQDPRLALAWAGRAMALAPQAWRPHAAAASILLRLGARAQARVETRLSLSGARYSNVPWDAVDLAARSARGLAELQEATPDEAAVRATLVQKLRSLGRDDEARAVAEAELQRGASGPPRTLLLTQLAELSPPGEPRWANELAQVAPCEGALWQSRATGREEPLVEGLRRCPADRALGEERVRRKLTGGDAAGAQAALEGLDTHLWPVEAHLLAAQVQDALARPTRAMAERRVAAELAPERAELALDYADRLDRLGDRRGAREALERFSQRASGTARTALEERLRALAQ
jgi:O-antigen ligase